jgi:ornithine cyclodeaminase/alanine dehydrogenase-like protein (mu-crystallin family)
MSKEGIIIKPTDSVQEAVDDVDFIITLTNANRTYPVIEEKWLKPGVHINAMGGDAPGSSELDRSIVKNADIIVVEFLEQTKIEGETQQLLESGKMSHVVEIEDFLKSKFDPNQIQNCSIFDGVGIALLDYSAMRLIWELCHEHEIGHQIKMLPPYKGDKNLYQFLSLNSD